MNLILVQKGRDEPGRVHLQDMRLLNKICRGETFGASDLRREKTPGVPEQGIGEVHDVREGRESKPLVFFGQLREASPYPLRYAEALCRRVWPPGFNLFEEVKFGNDIFLVDEGRIECQQARDSILIVGSGPRRRLDLRDYSLTFQTTLHSETL